MKMRNLHLIFAPLILLAMTGCLNEKVSENAELSSSVPEVPVGHPAITDPLHNPGSQKVNMLTNGVLQMGSRKFVASVFREVFYSEVVMTQADLMALNNILDASVLRYPTEFGGRVNLYSTRGLQEISGASCFSSCTNEEQRDIGLYVASTPARVSLLSQTCQRVLDNNIFFKEGLRKLEVDYFSPVQVSTEKINRIYELFYMGGDLPPEMSTAAMTAVKDAQKKGFSSLEQWRLAFLLICESPYWQIL